jgi:hypothetical protein
VRSDVLGVQVAGVGMTQWLGRVKPAVMISVLVAAPLLGVAACTADEPHLAVFDRPATSQDAIPDGIQFNEGSTFTTVRYVGDAGGGLVYAARSPTQQPWCAFAVPVEDEHSVVSSCTDDDHFGKTGILLGLTGRNQAPVAVLLLPDDFDGELPTDWEVVEPNLAVPAWRLNWARGCSPT